MRASIALTIETELVQGKVEVQMISAGMPPGQRARDRMGICRQMPSFAVPGGLSPLSGGGKRALGSPSGARVTGAVPSARAGSEGLGGGGGGFAFGGGELGRPGRHRGARGRVTMMISAMRATMATMKMLPSGLVVPPLRIGLPTGCVANR